MSNEPLKTLLPKFIKNLEEAGRSPSTILAYRSDLVQLIDYLEKFSKVTTDQVKSQDLEGFRDYLLSQKYTPKSVSRKLNAIKTFFRWLVTNSLIVKDVSRDVEHPRIEATLPKFLTQLEYRALRDAVRADQRIATIVELILQTGMRISEIANLKAKNVLQKEIIIEAFATQPERKIHLNATAKKSVDDYLKIRPETGEEFLFVSKNGKQLAVRNIRAAIDRHMQRAGVPNYSVNDLRTTFIVENLKRGVDLVVISKMAGHKRLSTTERYLQLAEISEHGGKQLIEEL
ncbi:MAG: Tyrosine recombinase XerC [Candidatus Woesebacteria bacterium GW2011_GWB1_43_14]|uniref:Tyrosine recombinase XerC n=1 Tax=Candidatus Woesebacteria bacterium GW2011_GWB1_43_14 TaxID=1618578 RepID=A0A0G1GJC6_9BACT|nr:MAG: Tyrosine recombinase XerC [Candidatus Woesebacteria bacterium GW2011_GWC1_42_9]KKS98873.1 MAG: Tyrosine recombinase XerC [Candidatus Woesebacteria bacterium GW2011_GWB1_43_14]